MKQKGFFMSEATQAPTLEQTLNKTSFGHSLLENKKVLLISVISVLVISLGYTFWKQTTAKAALKVAEAVYAFESQTWSSAKEGKLALADAVKAFGELGADVHASTTIVPVALEMGQFAFQKNEYAQADAVLSALTTKDALATFFVASQRAVVLEKLNKLPEAIAILENLAKNKDGLMNARVNLELGRLNLALGEKSKAQIHLDYVIQNHPNDESAKLAKLYLTKI